MVTIETLAPLQDSVLADSAYSTAEFLHEETPGFVSPELWPRFQPRRLAYKIWGCARKPIRDVDQMKQQKLTTGGDLGNGPAEEVTPGSVKAKEQHFKHVVTCDVMHCSK